MTTYVNVHGQPLGISAKDAVRKIEPNAVCQRSDLEQSPMWVVWKSPHRGSARIGTGATEESAWRDAWSRMLADDIAKEGRP